MLVRLHLSSEERLTELGLFSLVEVSGGLISVNTWKGSRKRTVRVFSVLPHDRTRGKEHSWESRRLWLNIPGRLWCLPPRRFSKESCKTVFRGLQQGVWTRWLAEVLSILSYFIILWPWVKGIHYSGSTLIRLKAMLLCMGSIYYSRSKLSKFDIFFQGSLKPVSINKHLYGKQNPSPLCILWKFFFSL